jgi:hypothetical protein
VAIAVVAANSFVGFSHYQRWQKDQATKLALLEAQKALAEKAAKLNAQRGQKVLAPVSKGFAMFVEPSSDAWPPIPWQAEEDGLLKFQIKSAGVPSFSGDAFEWYQPGLMAIPRRASSSTIFGGLGGTVIGQQRLLNSKQRRKN